MARGKGKRKSRHKSYTGVPSRQHQLEQQQRRELQEANQGFIGASNDEIRAQVEEEFRLDAEAGSEIPFADEEKKPQKWYVLDTNIILSCVDILYDKDDKEWRKPKNFKPRLDNAHLIIPYTVFEELDHIKSEISSRGRDARKAFRRLLKFFPNSGRNLGEIMHLEHPIETGLGTQTISLLPLHRNFSKILPWVPSKDDNDGWIVVTALAATMIREGLPVDGTLEFEDELGNDSELDILSRNNERKDVVLLSNDNSLLSKADTFGVRVRSYSFERPRQFTGCREMVVPPEMFELFYHEDKLSRVDFEKFFPDEPPLSANEYLIMKLERKEYYPRGYFSDDEPFKNIARYNKNNEMFYPMRFMKREGKMPPKNAGIATYYDALNDDKIRVINVTGAAGTGKTYQAITHAMRAVKNGEFKQIALISSKSAKNPLGALPGTKEQKMEPLVAAAKDALRSYVADKPEFQDMRNNLRKFGDDDRNAPEEVEEVTQYERKKDKAGYDGRDGRDSRRTLGDYTGSFDDLDFGTNDYPISGYRTGRGSKKKKDKAYYPGKTEKKSKYGGEGKMTYREVLEREVNRLYDRYFVCIPYEEAQGQSPEDSFIIIDEAQRLKVDDSDTLLSRPARGSKIVLCGDIAQIHDSSPEKQFANALNYSIHLFRDWEGCANIHLTENVRSDIADVMTQNRAKVRLMMGLPL